MAARTSTGVKHYVSTEAPATEDQVSYEALTWVEVGELTTLPAYGPTTQVVEHDPLGGEYIQKFKGSTNNGSVALSMADDPDDDGQGILSEYTDGTSRLLWLSHRTFYPMETGTLNDYYRGGVFSKTVEPGSKNNMVGSTANVEISTKVLRVREVE